MSENVKENVLSSNQWVRILQMVLIALICWAMLFWILGLVLAQIFYNLIKGESHPMLLDLGQRTSICFLKMFRFLTYNTEQKPFPFIPFPQSEEEFVVNQASVEAEIASDTAEMASNTEEGVNTAEEINNRTDEPNSDDIVAEEDNDVTGPQIASAAIAGSVLAAAASDEPDESGNEAETTEASLLDASSEVDQDYVPAFAESSDYLDDDLSFKAESFVMGKEASSRSRLEGDTDIGITQTESVDFADTGHDEILETSDINDITNTSDDADITDISDANDVAEEEALNTEEYNFASSDANDHNEIAQKFSPTITNKSIEETGIEQEPSAEGDKEPSAELYKEFLTETDSEPLSNEVASASDGQEAPEIESVDFVPGSIAQGDVETHDQVANTEIAPTNNESSYQGEVAFVSENSHDENEENTQPTVDEPGSESEPDIEKVALDMVAKQDGPFAEFNENSEPVSTEEANFEGNPFARLMEKGEQEKNLKETVDFGIVEKTTSENGDSFAKLMTEGAGANDDPYDLDAAYEAGLADMAKLEAEVEKERALESSQELPSSKDNTAAVENEAVVENEAAVESKAVVESEVENVVENEESKADSDTDIKKEETEEEVFTDIRFSLPKDDDGLSVDASDFDLSVLENYVSEDPDKE